MNNFQRLFEEDEELYKNHHETIRQNLMGTLGVFRFVGQIVEVYLPRVADMIISFSGGNISSADDNPQSPDSPSGPSEKGPVVTGDIR